MFVQILGIFLFIMTLVACLVFIHFIIKNYEDFSQRLSNLLYFELAVFYIFYVAILVMQSFFHEHREGVQRNWILGFLQIRMLFALFNIFILLEVSIMTILKQNFMNTYLLLSTHFMWSPYLVIKAILLMIIQSLVNIVAEDDDIKIKIINAGGVLKNYVAVPVYFMTFLFQNLLNSCHITLYYVLGMVS